MSDTPTPGEVARLHARLDDLERRLASVVEAVTDLAGIAADVTALSRQLTAGPPRRPAAAGPSWFEADPAQAVAMLRDLTAWVTAILVRHNTARESLPECWMLHGEVVESLLALRATWVAAYHDPGGTAALVADWHDRRLPAAMDRVRRYPGPSCTFDDHRGGTTGYRLREEHHPHERLRPVTPDEAATYARWWTSTRGLGPQPPPTLP